MELDLWWSKSNFVTVVVATCILVLLFWYKMKSLRKKQPQKSLPQGHMGRPLIGNTIAFIRAYNSQNPDAFLNNLKLRYGKTGIYKTNLFWNRSIIVCNPELCRKVLTDDEHFISGYPIPALIQGGKQFDFVSSSGHKRFRRLTAGLNGKWQ